MTWGAIRSSRGVRQAGELASIALALVWAFVRVGPQTTSDIVGDATRALGWPNPDASALQSYNRTSPLGPLLFKALPMHTTGAYLALYAMAFLLAMALLAAWLYLAVPRTQGSRAVRLIILGPAVAAIFVSMGNYDPFTFLCIALVLFAWRYGGRVALISAGVLLGCQHFEQGFVALVALSLAVMATESLLPENLRNRRQPLWALIG